MAADAEFGHVHHFICGEWLLECVCLDRTVGEAMWPRQQQLWITPGDPGAGATDSGSGNAVVPVTNFGYTGLLQLHGANGWVPWTSGIAAGQFDERYSASPCVRISNYHNYYNFLAYAQPSSSC